MYAVTGITGKVGGKIAEMLLARGEKVRAIIRDQSKAEYWESKGCEVIIASVLDSEKLAQAFYNTSGVFLMSPPNYDPAPGFPGVVAMNNSYMKALELSNTKKVVYLSTVGAQVSEFNLLNNSGLTEEMLAGLPMNVCFLRAAWFMENAAWDVSSAVSGIIPTYLQPLDHKIPMVATIDIADNVVQLLTSHWEGHRVVELESEHRYSAQDIADCFSTVLSKEVITVPVDRSRWESTFRGEGMKYPEGRMRMLDGFNEGWIDFEGNGKTEHRTGKITLLDVISMLVN